MLGNADITKTLSTKVILHVVLFFTHQYGGRLIIMRWERLQGSTNMSPPGACLSAGKQFKFKLIFAAGGSRASRHTTC